MEIDEWGNNQLKNAILEPKIEYLDQSVRKEMDEIQYNLKFIERKINATFKEYLNFSIKEDNFNSSGNSRFTDLLFGAGIRSGIGLILADLILPGVTIVSAGIFLIIQSIKGINNSIGNHEKIKMKVVEEGFKKFNESTESEISGRISQVIDSAFSHRVEAADTGIKQIILSCENLLKQQEKAHQETLEQREVEKAWLAQKRQELEQVQNGIEAILKQCTG
jgi:hypothetical protein